MTRAFHRRHEKLVGNVSIPKTVIGRYLGMAEATIEDPDPTYPAFGFRPSRVVDEVDLRVYLSEASYAVAEKEEGRMALKIEGSKAIPKYIYLVFHHGNKDAS